MIRLVCLGSSASVPTARHVPSHFAVKFGGVYLFDCAEGCQRQMMKFGVPYGSLSAIFLTHLHADHVLGLPGLMQTLNLAGQKDPLPIFGPPGTKAFCDALFGIRGFRPDFPVPVTEVSAEKKAVCFENALFSVSSFPVQHSAIAVGYVLEENEKIKFNEDLARSRGIKGRLFTEITEKKKLTINGQVIKLADVTYKQPGKKLVFTGDTQACASTLKAAKGADVLVHDCSFIEKDADKAAETKHSTAFQAATLAKKAAVKRLILTHIGNRYEPREPVLAEAKTVFEATDLAHEGKEWFV
ncbi:ribonuclease Z [Candidatus Micrarchaeota archaeon]|nr:ribonuclease Z [Candidatus Micrarchaeota archaeon]